MHRIVVVTKKVHCPEDGKSTAYEKINITGTSNRKRLFSVLRYYLEKKVTLCCESSFLLT